MRLAALGVITTTGCNGAGSTRDHPPHDTRAEQFRPELHRPRATSGEALLDTVSSGLEVPWALDFAPDGRVFVTERGGRIRVIVNGVLRDEPWAEFPVFAHEDQIGPESGLMGIALSPDFARSGHVFVVGTFWKRSPQGVSRMIDKLYRRVAALFSERAAVPYENRVYRLTDSAGSGTDAILVIDDLPANHYHAGGALAFGPDGHLYVTVGEALASAYSNDPEEASGRILRYRADGTIPDDNPRPGSPVFAIGLRNSQALAWHPVHGVLLATEHGPSRLPHERGRSDHDELNVVTPGANFGWPVVAGGSAEGKFDNPIAVWTPAIAPAGLAIYTGAHAPWKHNAFVGGLRGEQLRRVVLDSTAAGSGHMAVVQEEVLLSQAVGRIRAVRMGPDGHLWITTSNRDGRGSPSARDDLLLRVSPLEHSRGVARAIPRTTDRDPR